ncbi:ABC transporter permease [Thermogemmatispora sp.]|uniref:ABC transporter permease n=1 Tax=Thermogemmatispora sp. TaxID=1968838 RepID=UPI0035E4260C
MIQFLIKRLIGLVFVVIGVTFITFIMGYFAPGDPIRTMLGEHFSPQLYAQLKHAYGLDLPWYQQYWNFLVHLAHFDFGYSFKTQGRPVWDILRDGVPVSMELALWALVIYLLIGVPVGIISALKANTWVDTLNMGIMLVLYAMPIFVFCVLVQVLIVFIDQETGAGWPVANWGEPWHYTWSDIQFKLAPVLVFGLAGAAYFARITRTSMLEVMRQDYIRTARAKGLSERLVIYRHALRNALIPLITVTGVTLGFTITGAFLIENIFNIPGIGTITVSSVLDRDYPVIQATTVLLAVGVVLGNLLADIAYTLVDPRIKLE